MGLDMMLYGEEYGDYQERFESRIGRRLDPATAFTTYELGYWRKHPNLHGYIVTKYAEGVDECQRIDLSEENLKEILAAVEADALPHTEGFFFGESSAEDKEPSVQILKRALAWLQAGGVASKLDRAVYYRASW